MGVVRRLDTFHAIADPSRRRILELVRERERTAGDLARRFPFSWPALSQHLRLLKRAGLVIARRDGRSLWYRANPGPLDRECGAWIEEMTAFWRGKLRALKEHVEGSGHARRGRKGRV